MYISGRSLGSSAKVSLQEPGPARFALTADWVKRTGYQVPEGRDRRLAVQWERPRPRLRQMARPLTITVPWNEVVDRGRRETGEVVMVPAPPKDRCVHFDIVYTPAGATSTGYPGSRSMGTGLVGSVHLANGEQVFVTWLERLMTKPARRQLIKLRSSSILDADGREIEKSGMLAFGRVPNPDADDRTFIGTLLDVTRTLKRGPATETTMRRGDVSS